MKMKVSEILKMYLDSKRDWEKNIRKATKKRERCIKDMGMLINKLYITQQILTECEMEVEILPEYMHFFE